MQSGISQTFSVLLGWGWTANWNGVGAWLYEVSVTFDDGVTQDRQTNINEGVMLVGAGLLSKYTFLTDKKYGQGLTEAQATEELARIAKENAVNVRTVDNLFGTMT